jgi:hypothetical protein
MCAECKGGCVSIKLLCLLAWAGAAPSAFAQSATRDLSGYSDPGVTFTVSITIDTPPGTFAVGLEESPPPGWSVSNMSNGGTWDTQSEKVKWGPFSNPSIPALVTYDVTQPGGQTGERCFAGTVSFDGSDQPIEGDQCVGVAIPTLPKWGVVVMTLLVLMAGVLLLARRPAHT